MNGRSKWFATVCRVVVGGGPRLDKLLEECEEEVAVSESWVGWWERGRRRKRRRRRRQWRSELILRHIEQVGHAGLRMRREPSL